MRRNPQPQLGAARAAHLARGAVRRVPQTRKQAGRRRPYDQLGIAHAIGNGRAVGVVVAYQLHRVGAGVSIHARAGVGHGHALVRNGAGEAAADVGAIDLVAKLQAHLEDLGNGQHGRAVGVRARAGQVGSGGHVAIGKELQLQLPRKLEAPRVQRLARAHDRVAVGAAHIRPEGLAQLVAGTLAHDAHERRRRTDDGRELLQRTLHPLPPPAELGQDARAQAHAQQRAGQRGPVVPEVKRKDLEHAVQRLDAGVALLLKRHARAPIVRYQRLQRHFRLAREQALRVAPPLRLGLPTVGRWHLQHPVLLGVHVAQKGAGAGFGRFATVERGHIVASKREQRVVIAHSATG